ncbi:MAG: trehalose-phosphatase, partial [Pseudolabrys sp.]
MTANTLDNHAAIDDFAALDPGRVALLLDFDGTLVDIAPTPDAVHVPAALCNALARLLQATGGALALVSGRPIADLDRRFSPLKLPIVGGHGAELRVREGETISAVPPLPEALRRRLAEAQALDPGILVEDKGYSLALHYRNAMQSEEALRRHIAEALVGFPGERLEVLPGKALFEVKRPGVSKGESVRLLMRHAPFAGRVPVFIGDDITDETVFAQIPALGGKGYAVGRHFAGVTGIFE